MSPWLTSRGGGGAARTQWRRASAWPTPRAWAKETRRAAAAGVTRTRRALTTAPTPLSRLAGFERRADNVDLPAASLFPRLLDLSRRWGGGLFCVWFGERPCVVVADPEAARYVLDGPRPGGFVKGYDYDCSRVMLGAGVLTAGGEEWRRARKGLRPPFAPARVRELPEAVARHVEPELRAGPANALELSSRAFIGATLEKFFGLPQFSPSRTAEVLAAVEVLVRRMGERFERFGDAEHPWYSGAGGCPARGSAAPADPEAREAHAALLALLDESRHEGDGGVLFEPDQFLSLLLVGHDAGAALFAWLADELARSPGEAAALQAELDAAPAGAARSYAGLAALPRLGAAVSEGLRLHAPAAGFGRYTTEEHEIGGYAVPAGTFLLVSPYITHRMPELWPDAPDEFRPDRFVGRKRDRGAAKRLYPFGYGPRNCLGQVAAVAEVKAALAAVLQRFDIRPAAGTGGAAARSEFAGLVSRPAGGVEVVLEARA